MAKLICNSCGYKIRMKTERIPQRCPNCGKYERLEFEPSAGQILQEVM